jgi:hypothetical protein
VVDIVMLRRQAVLAGSAWVAEHTIPSSMLDAAIKKYAASARADIVAGCYDRSSRFLKMDRTSLIAALEADTREAIDGGVEEKIEFLLDYAIGSLEPSRFIARLEDVVRR